MAKNIIDKLSVDEENHEYLLKNYQEGRRFKLFSNVFFGKINVMSRTNWLMLLFCLPAIAAIIYTAYRASDIGLYVPFSASLGIGNYVVPNVESMYDKLMYENNMFRALLLVPSIIVIFIGCAGAFNVIKYESLGFNVKVIKTFFKGIKNNFVTYMWLGLINSLVFFQLMWAANFYGVPDLHLAIKIVSIALSSLLMAFVLIISFFVMAQSALYDLPLTKMIKNAFWFTISFIVQNIIILVLSLIPVGLLFLTGISYFMLLIIVMILCFVGISYIVCVWTIYSHYVFEMLFTARMQKPVGKKKKQKGNK